MNTLAPNGLHLQEHVSLTYGIILEGHNIVPLKDVLRPGYWQHHAAKLRPGDKIEVRTEGNVYYAELLVTDVVPLAARTHVLLAVALDDSDEAKEAISLDKVEKEDLPETEGYEVKWVSPTKKWGVKRVSDTDWARTGFSSKTEAQKWAVGDMKSLAA